jgi:hypothetical protein
VLRHPSGLRLEVRSSIAGRIPVLVVEDRQDFVTLVQAFADRNEPTPVPEAMGACIITGLNNWDRIQSYRAAWEAARQPSTEEETWDREFRRLIPRKELYQDRLIILSCGPYSATSARDVGLEEGEWITRSLVIRREHEFTHYLAYRVFNRLRQRVLDEVIADFVGLVTAFGGYRADLAARFLGLEAFPSYRLGGRFEKYRGQPQLSDGAFAVLQHLAVRAMRNLAGAAVRWDRCLVDLSGLARLVLVLIRLTLEELASSAMADLVARRLPGA